MSHRSPSRSPGPDPGSGPSAPCPSEGEGRDSSPLLVHLIRGGPHAQLPESTHRVHAVVVTARGEDVLGFGEVGRTTMVRSAAKPFQALPLVEEGLWRRVGGTPELLALTTASHSGEPGHVDGVRALLDRTGGREEELACGPHAPMDEAAALELCRSGSLPRRIHNNCSGKHAGMIALARHLDAPVDGYHRAGHPVQERMALELSTWTDVERARLVEAVDGCGVVCFGVPLRSLALAFGRLMGAAESGDPGPRSVVRAMTAHPWAVAGSGRLCTDLMSASRGRLLAKVGAEGVYGAAVAGADGPVGLALKVESGSRRAAEQALLHLLEALELEEQMGVRGWLFGVREAHPAVESNTRGEPAARWEVEAAGRGGEP